ncbi:hypothetical protein F4604DRAFT_1824796 [Suillus subluteus]|nr:hypothetical protein F4604DRAFT_1824796 [Suillus subluteus]
MRLRVERAVPCTKVCGRVSASRTGVLWILRWLQFGRACHVDEKLYMMHSQMSSKRLHGRLVACRWMACGRME